MDGLYLNDRFGLLLTRPPNVCTFRASRMRQIEARSAANGHSLGKGRNKELAHS
jgi:hypothetical protein